MQLGLIITFIHLDKIKIMKDEIIHKQDFDIFEHRYNELRQLKEDCATYESLIRQDLKSNFVAIPDSVINRIGLSNQYYTNDEVLKDQEEYIKLLKQYNKLVNRTLIQRILNFI